MVGLAAMAAAPIANKTKDTAGKRWPPPVKDAANEQGGHDG